MVRSLQLCLAATLCFHTMGLRLGVTTNSHAGVKPRSMDFTAVSKNYVSQTSFQKVVAETQGWIVQDNHYCDPSGSDLLNTFTLENMKLSSARTDCRTECDNLSECEFYLLYYGSGTGTGTGTSTGTGSGDGDGGGDPEEMFYRIPSRSLSRNASRKIERSRLKTKTEYACGYSGAGECYCQVMKCCEPSGAYSTCTGMAIGTKVGTTFSSVGQKVDAPSPPGGIIPAGGKADTSGDPTATNMNGDKFEILALGTFSFLTVKEKPSDFAPAKPLFSLDATIERATATCSATFIKSISMTGPWISQAVNMSEVEIRAGAWISDSDSKTMNITKPQLWQYLEVKFENHWLKLDAIAESIHHQDSRWASIVHSVSKKTKKSGDLPKIVFDIHGMNIKVNVNKHRLRYEGQTKKQIANYLEIDLENIKSLEDNGIQIGGLLGYDNHLFATKPPDQCKVKSHKENLKVHDIQKVDNLDVELTFLSAVKIS